MRVCGMSTSEIRRYADDIATSEPADIMSIASTAIDASRRSIILSREMYQ
jgi:hypothetical protein